MTDFDRGLSEYDRPEILYRLFFPRHQVAPNTREAQNHYVAVDPGVSICCRYYTARTDGPNILYFHGNGEIAADYDYVAPVYAQYGMNLFVTDYRGYGGSDGFPTCTSMIKDAHPMFEHFMDYLKTHGHTGKPYVMGRSLGSAPAIELAYHHQDRLKGLIVESGFARAGDQIERLGVEYLFEGNAEPIGFGNDLKIKEVTIPTLILHGEWDTIIPATEGKKLYELSGSHKKSSLFIPNAGHNDIMMLGLKAYMETISAFIDNLQQIK
ncbi:MAG: alpha/beta hydrolase [Syntrophorhabdus sp.]